MAVQHSYNTLYFDIFTLGVAKHRKNNRKVNGPNSFYGKKRQLYFQFRHNCKGNF